jgi:hypothetical protein
MRNDAAPALALAAGSGHNTRRLICLTNSYPKLLRVIGAMNTDVARTWDWIGSVVLFAFAILIILAFGFL